MIAIVALIAGILIGSLLQWPSFNNDKLTGSVGRVDRYRNVQITENDILLRNEFLGEPQKQELYKNYLNYYYFRAMRTSAELNRATASARLVPEFRGTFLDYEEGLSGFANYLDASRTDILKALDVIVNIEAHSKAPVVEYLNQANNVIARMRQYDNVLIDFMIAIESFLAFNPETEFPGLADAHDMLVISLLESALVTQSKPLLKMLDKKALANNEEGIKELLMSVYLSDSFEQQFNFDVEKLGTGFTLDAVQLGTGFSNTSDYPGLGSAHTLASVLLFNEDNLGMLIASDVFLGGFNHFDVEQLGAINNFEQLGGIAITDAAMLHQMLR